MTIKTKILLLGILGAGVPIITVLGLTLAQKSSLVTDLRPVLESQRQQMLTSLAQDAYALCKSQQESIEQTMKGNLNVARYFLKDKGGLRVSSGTARWDAVNQVTKKSAPIDLPRLAVGGTELGQNFDAARYTPVIDDAVSLVGGTCTIFQKMNAAGDMIRVATNVQTKDGRRAIGTFIPAVGADGKPNAVVSTVMGGKTYTGKAFVVDTWYITSYEPLTDAAGNIIGMLYVGIKQENVTSLRKALMAAKAGSSGYVYVLRGTGDQKGEYVISRDGKEDGANAWDLQDASGDHPMQRIINDAIGSGDGRVSFLQYADKNTAGGTVRERTDAAIYFAPWDWVIGVGSYDDEMNVAETQTLAALNRLVWGSIIAGSILMALSIVLSIMLSSGIANPISRVISLLTATSAQASESANQVSAASQQLSEGANEQAAALEETSASLTEMSSRTKDNTEYTEKANQLAQTTKTTAVQGNSAMGEMTQAMAAINESSDKISHIIKSIESIAFQTNLLALNAAVEAARAGEYGQGFAVVAEEVRHLAEKAAGAARDTSQLIADNISRTRGGAEVVKRAADALHGITESAEKVAVIVADIARASREQSEGIDQISQAVSQVDQVTQKNASAAEETASASEELSAQAETLRKTVEDLERLVGFTGAKTEQAVPA